MRKFFLFFAALMMSVAANAFTLTLQNSDLGKNESVTSDSEDVFGDGKVSVHTDYINNTVLLTLNEASIKSTNAQTPLIFKKDADYQILKIMVKGHCSIESSIGRGIDIEEGGQIYIVSEGSNAILDINSKYAAVNMKQDVALFLGNQFGEALDINLTINDETGNNPLFLGSGGSYVQRIVFFFANVKMTVANNNPLLYDIEFVEDYKSHRLSDGVVLKDNKFKKNDAEYKGNLTLTAPYDLKFDDTYIFPDEADDIKKVMSSITGGKVSYDHSKRTLTLYEAKVPYSIYSGYDNFTVYLKGFNNINPSSSANTNARLWFNGDHGTLTGDADAILTISCGGKSDAIYALGGLEIKSFKSLITYAAKDGIVGNTTMLPATNILKISVPIQINCATDAIPVKNFDELVVTNSYLQLSKTSQVFEYSIGQRMFVRKDNNLVPADFIVYEYPVYMDFYDVEIDARNMTDIQNQIAGFSEGTASYDATTGKLTLSGFKNNTATVTRGIMAETDLTIVLVGENEIAAIDMLRGIESNEHNLIIEGPGSLKVKSLDGDAFFLHAKDTLTICKGATVEAMGEEALYGDALLMCNYPMDPPLIGDAAKLIINNATLIAKTEIDDHAAIRGFYEPTLTDAALTTAGVRAAFECDGMNTYAGYIDNNTGKYAKEITITKTGASAITNTETSVIKGTKTIIDGKLFILCGEHMYDAQGQMVK